MQSGIDILRAIVEKAESDSEVTRCRSLMALGALVPALSPDVLSSVAPVILQRVTDPSPAVREAATHALRELVVAGYPDLQSILSTAMDAFADEDEGVRGAAVHALAALARKGVKRAMDIVCIASLADSQYVRLVAGAYV